MAAEAPLSKHKKNNFKIYIGVCIVLGAVFAYDGYLSKYQWSHRLSFYEDHVKDGKADDTMMFNRIAPIFLVAAAGALALRLRVVRDKKLLADENELIISQNEKIPYDSVQKIDKTYFQSKGFFSITYKNADGRLVTRKLNDRNYDNLAAVLDEVVAKIS
jgi:hypothetical protein